MCINVTDFMHMMFRDFKQNELNFSLKLSAVGLIVVIVWIANRKPS